MHDKPMAEHDGKFRNTTPVERPCHKCGGPVTVQVWDSDCGGYEDEKFTCGKCGYTWWVDGPDS